MRPSERPLARSTASTEPLPSSATKSRLGDAAEAVHQGAGERLGLSGRDPGDEELQGLQLVQSLEAVAESAGAQLPRWDDRRQS
jgi:hypothetical protein